MSVFWSIRVYKFVNENEMVFGAKEVVNDNKLNEMVFGAKELNEMGFWNEGRRGY